VKQHLEFPENNNNCLFINPKKESEKEIKEVSLSSLIPDNRIN